MRTSTTAAWVSVPLAEIVLAVRTSPVLPWYFGCSEVVVMHIIIIIIRMYVVYDFVLTDSTSCLHYLTALATLAHATSTI